METALVILAIFGSLGLGLWCARAYLIGWFARGGQPGFGAGDDSADSNSDGGHDHHSHHDSGSGDSGADSGGGDGGSD